jgi:hypothetical protein
LASAASFTFALKWSEDNVDVQSEPNLIQIVVSRSEIGAARPLSCPVFTQFTRTATILSAPHNGDKLFVATSRYEST